MRVIVKLHGTLRRFLPAGSIGNATSVDVPDAATVATVIGRLGIPAEFTKMTVSGDEHLQASSVLRDGQELNLFPPLAGGT
jgi:molybdopterin converting factor small subunit